MSSDMDISTPRPASPDPSARGSLRRLHSGISRGQRRATSIEETEDFGLEHHGSSEGGGTLRPPGAREFNSLASPPGARRVAMRRSSPRRFAKLCFCCILALGTLYLWRYVLIKVDGTYRNPFATKPWVDETPEGPVITFGTMGTAHNVGIYGAGASGLNDTGLESWSDPVLSAGSMVVPPPWDSTLCMEHWGRKELQTEADPNGYVVFVNGMEQLGGNKFLLADGMFIAKMLSRTLVEYPVKDARVSAANSTLGLGAYWDLSAMCMNHRILDISTFRGLVEQGRVRPEDFVTIETSKQSVTTRHFKHAANVQNYYKDYDEYKVIVMEHTWKSSITRHTMAYLRPNPFYLGIARMLLVDHEDFRNGEFLAVQWRTETATGDMSECYDEVRRQVEEHRLELGYSRDQVLFSTDMFGNTSGTYSASKKGKVGRDTLRRIRQDYPKALDNRLHEFFNRIQDSGVKAIVSGLVVSSARVLLASSLNTPSSKANLEAGVCQKPYSGYIRLITEWRRQLMQKDPSTVVRLFPFEAPEDSEPAVSTDSTLVVEPDGEGGLATPSPTHGKVDEGDASEVGGGGEEEGRGEVAKGDRDLRILRADTSSSSSSSNR